MVVLNFSKFRRYSIKTCVRIVFAYAGSLFILFISGPGKKERWKGPKISWHCFGSLILPRFILEHKVSEAVTLLWASCFRHKPIGIYLSPRKPLTLITRAVVPNLYSSPTDSFLVYITFRVQLNPTAIACLPVLVLFFLYMLLFNSLKMQAASSRSINI